MHAAWDSLGRCQVRNDNGHADKDRTTLQNLCASSKLRVLCSKWTRPSWCRKPQRHLVTKLFSSLFQSLSVMHGHHLSKTNRSATSASVSTFDLWNWQQTTDGTMDLYEKKQFNKFSDDTRDALPNESSVYWKRETRNRWWNPKKNTELWSQKCFMRHANNIRHFCPSQVPGFLDFVHLSRFLSSDLSAIVRLDLSQIWQCFKKSEDVSLENVLADNRRCQVIPEDKYRITHERS